jgi:hypothetical protein
MSATIIGFPSRVPDKAARLRARWSSEWAQGAAAALEGKTYPAGFSAWSIDRKNGWWSGYNRGRHDRLRLLSESGSNE